MRKFLMVVAFAVAVVGCGGDDETTWGDVSADLAAEYCQAAADCGYDVDVELCSEHTAWHLCEEERTCDDEVDGDVSSDALEACGAALAALDEDGCFWLSWGVIPDECIAVLELDPSLDEDNH